MSFMFEVYYKPPANPAKEAAVTNRVAAMGGRLDFREEPDEYGLGGICLTYEFENRDGAARAADALRQLEEHGEGTVDYGR